MPVSSRGFTLIELMVVAAIVAILAAIAYPSYQQYIIRGKRSAAQAQMMDIANRQQQYLLANRSYASKTQLESGGYALPSEVSSNYGYSITVGSGTPPTFTITFTPSGAQASDGNLTLSSDGSKTPAAKW
ncbi:type IV pilin protein [Pseudomonas sp. NY15437]|uniref:type IV pilin protein n=1 Tax=unclassified Pseudomonas TaxID=196821 RepID=UPI00223A7B43|nr:type IV pilin protein [Pseudomonas sp. GCEP-101]